jgi:spore germination protein KA
MENESFETRALSVSLAQNLKALDDAFSENTDIVIRRLNCAGIECAVIKCEGLASDALITEGILKPLASLAAPPAQTPAASEQSAPPGQQSQPSADWLFSHLRACAFSISDQKETQTFGEMLSFLLSGFAIFLADGVGTALALGVQSIPGRGVGDAETEVMERAAKEAFIENLVLNCALIRKRLKTPSLRFEKIRLGETSKTQVALIYLADRAGEELLQKVRERLNKIPLDTVLETGYIQPWLDTERLSFFKGVEITERPDTLCAKLSEGRVGIMVDGSPFVLYVPYLFAENFQTFDDYTQRPFFASYMRVVKYICFFASLLLPGLYVAIATIHPEFLPSRLLYFVAASNYRTPFSPMTEAVLVLVMYEVIQQAGLRLPKSVGGTVGLLGAIIIGDVAVGAGLLGAPIVIIVALTEICSFVVPKLYHITAVLRLLFIIIGGILGVYGIVILLFVLVVNICSINPYGVPHSAAISPFSKKAMRDVPIRASWKTLAGRTMNVDEMVEKP